MIFKLVIPQQIKLILSGKTSLRSNFPTDQEILRFPVIEKMTKAFLCFPHSNAEVEHLFSQVVLIKTKNRNKLKIPTLDALLMAKQGLPHECTLFDLSSDMLRLMNKDIFLTQVLISCHYVCLLLRKKYLRLKILIYD